MFGKFFKMALPSVEEIEEEELELSRLELVRVRAKLEYWQAMDEMLRRRIARLQSSKAKRMTNGN